MSLNRTPSTPDIPVVPGISVDVFEATNPFAAVVMNAPAQSQVQIDFPTGGGGLVTSVFGRTGNIAALASDYAAFYEPLGGGAGPGSGAVDSVFGRTGTVIAQSGDYLFNQIGSRPSTLLGYGITDAEHALGNPSASGYVLISTSAGVRSWVPMTGGTGGGSISSGPVTISSMVSGQPYLDVLFGTAQPDANWELAESLVVNTTDSTPLNIYPGLISSKSTTGFRINFNGAPDSANYKFHWSFTGTASTAGDMPTGGTTGQVLTKVSSTNFDASWQTPTGGGGADTIPPTAPTGLTVTPIA